MICFQVFIEPLNRRILHLFGAFLRARYKSWYCLKFGLIEWVKLELERGALRNIGHRSRSAVVLRSEKSGATGMSSPFVQYSYKIAGKRKGSTLYYVPGTGARRTTVCKYEGRYYCSKAS